MTRTMRQMRTFVRSEVMNNDSAREFLPGRN